MAKKKTKQTYSQVDMPEPDGRPRLHRPRRNYWGNLKEEDSSPFALAS